MNQVAGILSIEFEAGDDITVASIIAQRVANILGLSVKFDFNGVTCVASPGGSSEALSERYSLEVGRDLKGPFDQRRACSL